MKSNKAFTLNELIFALAVVAIILAILIPTLWRVRDSADRALSSSNLRQLGIALQAYVADNQMQILPAVEDPASLSARGMPSEYRYWVIELVDRGYIEYGDVFFSPSYPPGSRSNAKHSFVTNMHWSGHIQTYGMRRWVPYEADWSGGNRDVPQNILNIESPANFMIIAECVWGSGTAIGSDDLSFTGSYQIGYSPSTQLFVSKDGTVLALYLDGSVKSRKASFFTDAANRHVTKYSGGQIFQITPPAAKR